MFAERFFKRDYMRCVIAYFSSCILASYFTYFVLLGYILLAFQVVTWQYELLGRLYLMKIVVIKSPKLISSLLKMIFKIKNDD